ncbi:hypothetical protein ACFLTO_05975, partial [Chloroflexota bacterium]
MMLRTNMKRRIIGTVLFTLLTFIISPSVFAAEPHEDPETAELVFSGISLFRYYSDALDSVLRKSPTEVEAKLEKMPFSNIPQSLAQARDTFTSSSINTTHLIVGIDENLTRLQELMAQFRFEEAIETVNQTFGMLGRANSLVVQIEQATEVMGTQLEVFSAPERSALRQSYNELLYRIDRIKGLLEQHEKLLESTSTTLKGISTSITLELETTGITLEELSEATGITLEELLE